jgi:hypothetical protein
MTFLATGTVYYELEESLFKQCISSIDICKEIDFSALGIENNGTVQDIDGKVFIRPETKTIESLLKK